MTMAPSRLPSRIPTATNRLFKLDPPPMGDPISLNPDAGGGYKGCLCVTHDDRLGRPVLLKVRLNRALADAHRCRVTPNYIRLQPGEEQQVGLCMKDAPANCMEFRERVQILGKIDLNDSDLDLSASELWQMSANAPLDVAACKVVFRSQFKIYDGVQLRPSVLGKKSPDGDWSSPHKDSYEDRTAQSMPEEYLGQIEEEEKNISMPSQENLFDMPRQVKVLIEDGEDEEQNLSPHDSSSPSGESNNSELDHTAEDPNEELDHTARSFPEEKKGDEKEEQQEKEWKKEHDEQKQNRSVIQPQDVLLPNDTFDLQTPMRDTRTRHRPMSPEASSESSSAQDGLSPDRAIFKRKFQPSPNLAGLKTNLLRKDLGIVRGQMNLNQTKNGSFFEELKEKQERLEQNLTKAKAALKEREQRRMQKSSSESTASPCSERQDERMDSALQSDERSQDGSSFLERTTLREMSLTPPVRSSAPRLLLPDESSLIEAAAKIADMQEKIDSQSLNLAQKEDANRKLQHLLKGRDKIIADQDKIIADREHMLSERDKIIADRNKIIADKKNKLAAMEGQLEEELDQVAEKDQLLAEKELLLAERDQLLAEKEDLLAEKEEIIESRDETIEIMKYDITDMRTVLAGTEKDKLELLHKMKKMSCEYLKLKKSEQDLKEKLDREIESGRTQTAEVLEHLDTMKRMRRKVEVLEQTQSDKKDEQDGGKREPGRYRVVTRSPDWATFFVLVFLSFLIGGFLAKMMDRVV